MVSFTITNKRPNEFFLLLTLAHVSSGITLSVRERYVAGKVNVTRQMLNEVEGSSDDLTDIGDWSDLTDLDELIGRDILGLDQLPNNAWIEYFLPQLDELEDNAIANFELVDWFRQFGFVEKKSSFEIKGGINILPNKIDHQGSINKIALEKKFFHNNKFNNERDSLANETNPKEFAKLHLKLLKVRYR